VAYNSALDLSVKEWTYTTLSTSPKKMIDFIFHSNSFHNSIQDSNMAKNIHCSNAYVLQNPEPTKDKPVIPSDHRAIVATYST
jgi:hypothetical protein